MKTSIFKRSMALFLAFLLCFTTFIGSAVTPAFAAGTESEVVLIGFPRDGDDMYHTGNWGNEAMTLMNGWAVLRARQTIVRSVGSYYGPICYCLEPGVPLNSGDHLTDRDETYWDNYPAGYNNTISPDDIKLLIGRIMQYGYTGTVSDNWRTQNEGGDKLAHATATQLLIWETVVGERDADFKKVSTGGYAAVLDQISEDHPLRDKIMSYYNSIVASVQSHTTLPSFMARSTGRAQTIELRWDGSQYSATLTDTNNVLSNYTFSANAPLVRCSVSGNQLTITTTTTTDGPVTITASKNNSQRRGIITWTDGHTGPDGTLQDLVTYTQSVTDPIQGYLNIVISLGSMKIVKTSEDGNVLGIPFTVKGNGVNKTVWTNSAGEIQIDNLTPGTYTVTEQPFNQYAPQESRTVTVVSGQTATVTFNNTLRRGNLVVTKTSEDGLVEGVKFHLYGTSVSGLPVDEYAVTDRTGRAYFRDVLAGTGYTLEEMDVPGRYVVPDSQSAAIEWNTVTQKSFENRLKKWNATVSKKDSETGTAQADGSLAGAVYGVYRGNELIDAYTTDAKGQFTTKYYVCGDDWSIREITPSEGYLLDSASHHVGAEARLYTAEYNSTSLSVTEQVIKGNIAIIKHTDSGETQLETPEAGAEFEVYLKSAGSYDAAKDSERDRIVCDNNGYAQTKDLPYGVYTVHQTRGWEGRELMSDFDVYVAENGRTYRYLINNAIFKSYIKIVKVDAESGKAIPYAGAGFQLYRPDGTKITQTVIYPDIATIDTFYTNDEGCLITPEALEFGTGYYLIEVAAPQGYVLDSTPVYFDVTEDNSIKGDAMFLVEVTKANMAQKGTVKISKTGEVFSTVTENGGVYQPVYEVKGLPGAVFEITAAEDIYTPDGTLRYGPENACLPHEEQDLSKQLAAAIQNIQGSVAEYAMDDPEAEGEDESIPADPEVRNFSYTVVDGQVYYRENSRMNPVEVSVTAANRIKGLIGIRDCVRTLIEYQTEDWPAEDIQAEQKKLNALYDAFVDKYGRITSRANNSAFNMDSSYFLLSSLEVLDDERNFVRKADMFTKRTIKQKVVVTSVDTASEALAVSLAEKAKVDMPYMMELTGKTEQEICEDLKGVIFANPMHSSMNTYERGTEAAYLTADEYLSGNVREKLAFARKCAEVDPDRYTVNVQALEQVQPTDLTASEISVRLGATWLPPEIIEQFMFELFSTPNYCQWNIHAHYFQRTGEWNIEGKSYDRSNVKANNTYGTSRINGYKIMEETLNLRDVRIFDYVYDEDGKKKPVLNKKETAIAQGKQELIKQAFQDWIWKDPQRRERLTRLYNDKFNSVRPREYDGSHINFVGINPEITLRPHQVNAIAHILYGGNTLLAHVVGAGKTFEMVAAAQESKRLGLCQKSLFVVPNHLTEQWASEYLQLYPSANILVATKKDFETKNRKRFCGRIATGDYDAIIIGHSQFEKIPVSIERQRYLLEQQRREILDGIAELKASHGERFSIKQMERTRKSIEAKLEKLNDQSRKDDVVTFEELGVDRIFIDEAHYYKNLAAFSKMRNVGGISQTEAQKSSDLYMKCRYLDELTGGRGVIFATGTPISNTMVELYTMQKYLQYHTLNENGLLNFDAWASTFGETVTAIELAPEGTGYRAKTRFSRFYNLPELMSMFKEVADIQTADMLNLPVPKANYHNVVLKPSEQQKQMVAALGERAERVRNKMVDSTEDNMLLITNDGRKLALDQRLLNPLLPDSDTGKVSACAENVFEIWRRTADQRSAQMVFCDLSIPKGNSDFNVYDDLRDKLIAKGIPAEEIAYIHSASTEVQKKELFGKVRSGQIRVLLGSTQKMGAGTNVQRKLVALHHLDCPWRPSDDGRTLRTHIKAEAPVEVSPLF